MACLLYKTFNVIRKFYFQSYLLCAWMLRLGKRVLSVILLLYTIAIYIRFSGQVFGGNSFGDVKTMCDMPFN